MLPQQQIPPGIAQRLKDLPVIEPILQNPTLVDGVFEGGGALGAAYAGALSALAHSNIWFARVAGTSAGSIIAAMIAVGFTAGEIQWLMSPPSEPPRHLKSLDNDQIQKPIDFYSFLDLPTLSTISRRSKHSSILWNGLHLTVIDEIAKMPLPIPTRGDVIEALLKDKGLIGLALNAIPSVGDLLAAIIPLPRRQPKVGDFLFTASALREQVADTLWNAIALNYPLEILLTNLIYEGSLFEGEKFLTTLRKLFGQRIHKNPSATVLFKDLNMPLAVIAADTKQGSGHMVVYSSTTHPEMEVAEAVRRSMSVPFVFQPRNPDWRIPDGNNGRIVDGGLCSNFPLWVFSASGKAHIEQLGNDEKRPKIGFALDDKRPAKITWNVKPPKYPGPLDDMDVIGPLLVDKLKELGIHSQSSGFDWAPVSQYVKNLKVVREIVAVNGLDKEDSTRTILAKGLMDGLIYFDVRIPLHGYHWLDFKINEEIECLYPMWDRGWRATTDVISMAPTTGTSQPLNPNANSMKSPYDGK
jgi:predicted acylesterase/phospholipase RssA